MSRGKYQRAGGSGKKKIMLVISILLLLTAAVGVTLAILSARSEPVSNDFAYKPVTCEVEEPGWEDGNTIKSNVKIKNTSDIQVYIRAAYVVTWLVEEDTNGDGIIDSTSVLAKKPAEGTDYTISLNENGWVSIDGLYYCNSPIEPGDSTPVLINSLEVLAETEGYRLQVEVIAEAVQATPEDAMEEAWGITEG